MALAVKMDEDLSPMVAQPLINAGYDVATVVSQGWRLKDHELWPRLQAEHRVLVTADKGFGDIRLYPPGQHAGIVLLRAERDSILDYTQLLQDLIARYRIDDLQGCLTVVSPRSIRIRR